MFYIYKTNDNKSVLCQKRVILYNKSEICHSEKQEKLFILCKALCNTSVVTVNK